jgi:hypothetical protein
VRALLNFGGKCAGICCGTGAADSQCARGQCAGGNFAGGNNSEKGHGTLRRILGLVQNRMLYKPVDQVVQARPALPIHRPATWIGYAVSLSFFMETFMQTL